MKILFLLASFIIPVLLIAQNIDVQHYEFNLKLSNETDEIKGDARVLVKLPSGVKKFSLDLVSKKKNGKGMEIINVMGDNVKDFSHTENKLTVFLNKPSGKIDTGYYIILYKGVPEDGLIISKNKYGERTFFSDNWPNRAHHWLPCNDRPDDKATVDFIVSTPKEYSVVSNGILNKDSVKKEALNIFAPGLNYFHWKQTTPIPTKVMVIGAARFAVKEYNESPEGIPVSAWVYPQDSVNGFYDYALATDILKFFINYIAPYPFKKLANVQSKTIFGGMENAGAIFYSENSVTGDRSSEALIAHEIAHQWFGNMASEKSFSHLWLSEGFATYLTNIYLEQKYGKDTLHQRLKEDKQEIINFVRSSNQPVVDSISGYMDLLNANSYQKGGWVLHMLRNEVGDKKFQKIIQSYYDQYKGGNADTRDFQKVAERISGKDLKYFFDQWLYQPGLPVLTIKEKLVGNELTFEITQGKEVYNFPLEIMVVAADNEVKTHRFEINKKTQSITVNTKGPAKVSIDPENKLLFILK